jgi:hypothetical protein
MNWGRRTQFFLTKLADDWCISQERHPVTGWYDYRLWTWPNRQCYTVREIDVVRMLERGYIEWQGSLLKITPRGRAQIYDVRERVAAWERYRAEHRQRLLLELGVDISQW